ncbi:EamA family transporter [Candidatus Microgenomates bacterium]|nr:EamA family transporter [Candidatus Microgenomates bacterium]
MSSQILSKPFPYIALVVAHLIWGATFVVAKITLQEFPPSSLAFLRFSLACLLLAPFVWAQRKKISVKKEDLPKLLAIGIFIITLNIAFFFEGIVRTTAINASVLTLIIPISSVLLGWLYLKEKIYLINLLGVLMGLAGALVIIGLPQIISGTYSSETVLGNILIILAALSFVGGAVFSEQMLKKYSTLTITAIAFLTGAVTFFIPAASEYIQNPSWSANITILGILGLLYMTMLSSISAYFLFEWGLARTNVIRADLFQYIEPFVAAALAVFILAERISLSFMIGASLIAMGVYLGTLAKEPHHKTRKAHRF